eukprot:403348226
MKKQTTFQQSVDFNNFMTPSYESVMFDLRDSQIRSRANTLSKKQMELVQEKNKNDDLSRNKGFTACICTICKHYNKNKGMHGSLLDKIDIVQLYNQKNKNQNKTSINESKRSSVIIENEIPSLQAPIKSKQNSIQESRKLEQYSFREIMLKLCGPHDQIQGCPINFVDTAFFDERGRISEVIKTDKDGFITCQKNDQKLQLQDIRRTFSYIVRERRKEISFEQLQLQQKSREVSQFEQNESVDNPYASQRNNQANSSNQGKTFRNQNHNESVSAIQSNQSPILKSKNSKQDGITSGGGPFQNNYSSILLDDDNDENQLHYKDAAILRDIDGYVKVETESEFISEFRRRANDPFWKSLECIQTCIKSKQGLGKHVFMPFKIEIRQGDSIDQEITYDFQSIGRSYEQKIIDDAQFQGIYQTTFEVQKEVEDKLRKENPQLYCERMTLKMGFYIQQIYQIEVLHMDLDYFIDDNGKIWLFYGKNIVVRPMKKTAMQILNETQAQVRAQIQQSKESTRLTKSNFKEDLEINNKSKNDKNNSMHNSQLQSEHQTINALERVMGKYFQNIKENLKIMKEFESSETEEESQSAMKILRPQLAVGRTNSKFKDIVAIESEKKNKKNKSYKYYQAVTKNLDRLNQTFQSEQKTDKKMLSQNELLRKFNNKSNQNTTTIDQRETYQTTISNFSVVDYNKSQMNFAKSMYLDRLESKIQQPISQKRQNINTFQNNIQEFLQKRKSYVQTQVNSYKQQLIQRLRDAQQKRKLNESRDFKIFDDSSYIDPLNTSNQVQIQFKSYSSQTGRKIQHRNLLSVNPYSSFYNTNSKVNRAAAQTTMKQSSLKNTLLNKNLNSSYFSNTEGKSSMQLINLNTIGRDSSLKKKFNEIQDMRTIDMNEKLSMLKSEYESTPLLNTKRKLLMKYNH